MEKIYSYIDEHSQRFIDELATFVRQPSISSQGVGTEKCAQLLGDMMEAVGIQAEFLHMGGETNPPLVNGEMLVPGAQTPRLIYGQYDVQPPEPLDVWESPPFEPNIRNGRVAIDGFYDDVLSVTDLEKKALAEIPFNEKDALEDLQLKGFNFSENIGFWETTTLLPSLNIAGYTSGYGGEGAKAIIPYLFTKESDTWRSSIFIIISIPRNTSKS